MMPAMPAFSLPKALGAFLLVAQVLAACATPGSSPEPAASITPAIAPSDTPIPSPEPTGTPSPDAFLAEADAALRNGDWDKALEQYQQARQVAVDTGAKAEAQLGVARTLLSSGRATESAQALDEFLAAYAGDRRAAEASFLRAVAREQLGQPGEALQDYQQYLAQRPGVIDAFVHEKIGDLWRAVGAPLDAVGAYRSALTAPSLGSGATLRVKVGRALVEANDADAALAEYAALAETTSEPTLLATLNYLSGLALELKGETAAAQARYLDSVQRFPEAYDTYSGLVRLVDAGIPVDPYLRGYIDFQAGAYEPAKLAMDRAIASSPTAAAHYYRALSLLEIGDVYGAIDDLRTVVLQYPDSTQRADAWLTLARVRWLELDLYVDSVQTYLDFVANLPGHAQAPAALLDAGRVAERSGDLAWAAEIWLRLPAEYPASAEASDGAFQAGIAHVRLQASVSAESAFRFAEASAQDPGERAAALLWIGKSRQALGDISGATEAWQAASAADPTGYYSLRAADLLADRPPFHSEGVANFVTDAVAERTEAESWLRSTFTLSGSEPLAELSQALRADPRLVRAEEFLRLGLVVEAKAELESLRLSVESDAEATYRLMHRLLELRMYPQAIFAARQVLRLAGMDDGATALAPDYFNRVRFAPYFGELILPAAADAGLDPIYVLSVVRQESLFEGYATSYAEARGLMQVIPSTGEQLAQQIGWPPGYTDRDLYRPIVSVRFGTAYLAEQRDRFDGDMVAALAAYNAGPGNALIWEELAPSDPDLFLEVIRLDQPHLYITTIYEVFCRYRDLYTDPPIS
jgi:soluble lytic murein transglycosylase